MALKVGAEDKKKVILAAALGVIVIGLLGYEIYDNFFSTGSPPPATVAVSTAPQQPAASTSAGATRSTAARGHEATKVGTSLAHLDPTLHPEAMEQAESLEYTGRGRNIFSMSAALPVIEAVKGPVRPVAAGPQAPAGPPPPPAIDLKFFGFESVKGSARKAFLLHGDDIFIAAEGDVVDHRYKVVKIMPFSLQVEDIPYHNTQTLSLVQN
jgi:hypothetical protein